METLHSASHTVCRAVFQAILLRGICWRVKVILILMLIGLILEIIKVA